MQMSGLRFHRIKNSISFKLNFTAGKLADDVHNKTTSVYCMSYTHLPTALPEKNKLDSIHIRSVLVPVLSMTSRSVFDTPYFSCKK